MDKESLHDYIVENRKRLMSDFIESSGYDDEFIKFCEIEFREYLDILRTDREKAR